MKWLNVEHRAAKLHAVTTPVVILHLVISLQKDKVVSYFIWQCYLGNTLLSALHL